MRLTIENVRVIDPANQIDEISNVYIARGRFVSVGLSAPEGFTGEHVIDGTGKWLIPGLIDLQGRLGEPGSTYAGSIASETKAAVAGGITTICTPPDTSPVADTQAVIELIQRRARQAATAFVLPIGAMTQNLDGELLANMHALQQEGCIAVSQANNPVQNPLVLRNALDYAASFDILVMMRCENQQMKNNGVAHAGAISSRLGLEEIPASAETIALARDLILVEESGVRAHFSQLSTARSVAMIADAKKRGLPVTCDVAVHHLHLTEYDTMDFNSLFHVSPPLRSQKDMDALRYGVQSGIIDAVVSDHTPLHPDDKLLPFGESRPGISGFETLLALMLKLVENGQISLMDAVARVTSNPANILQIDNGSLTAGQSADFCLIDPDAHWTLNREEMVSAGNNSPFDGWEFNGKIEATYFQGRPVYRNNDV
jgi:dihydroorotase